MRKGFVEPVVLPEPRFRDGLGIRYVRTDGTDDPVEVLRPLWDVGAMQNAIRQRVGRLASFRQARFVPLRAAEVPRDDASTIEVVSDYLPGYRLSQYLEASHRGTVSIESSTAIYIVRELLGALALLHESRGVTHGAVGPERVLITPKGRVVVADYVLGPAIERLEFTRPRLWREFRIPLPAGKGLAKLDERADVVQVGMTALALLLGRPIEPAEYPSGLDDLVALINQTRRDAGRPPLPGALITWVKRAVLKDPLGKFEHVSEARMSLESVVSKQDAASGGAVALKLVAEEFGQFAAAQEAAAAAAAAEEARKTALAAQAAAMDAIRAAAASIDATGPAANSVAAFTLLGEPSAASPDGAGEAAPVPDVDADPPVGWRVPEPQPVEETLPTSPLIQIDAPVDAPPEEEFAEEVLDLSALVGPDDADLATADESFAAEAAVDPAEQVEAPAPVADDLTAGGVVEITVELRELNTADDTVGVALPEAPIDALAAVDAALAGLAALETPAPEAPPETLPEWRLLADPAGANAPTIDVEEPTETLEELVAEFAATLTAEVAPAAEPSMPTIDEPSAAMEPLAVVAVPELIADSQVPAMDEPSTEVEPLAVVAVPELIADSQAPARDEPSTEVEPLAIVAVPELIADSQVPAMDEPSTEVEPLAVVAVPELIADSQVPVMDEPSTEVEPLAIVAEPPVTTMEEAAPVIEPPAVMLEARIHLEEAPEEFCEPEATQIPEEVASNEASSSVLNEILGLQEAQAAAQAAAEIRPDPPAVEPDISAWSFVEELLHHDARYEARSPMDDVPPQAPAVDVLPPAPAIETELEPPAEDVLRDVPGIEGELEPAALVGAELVSEPVAPALDEVVQALPTDWLIELGPSPAVRAPVPAAPAEPVEQLPARVPAPVIEPPPPAFAGAGSLSAAGQPPLARRPAVEEPEADRTGPVFPRVAPSVQRVRAEARRRKLVRLSRSIGRGLRAFVSGVASGVAAVAGGVTHVVSAAGRGAAAGSRAVMAGMLLAVTAVLRGIGGGLRATATGTTAVVRRAAASAAAGVRNVAALTVAAGGAALQLTRATARGSAAVVSVALKGTGRGLGALSSALVTSAGMASKAAIAVMRAGGSAISGAARALLAGMSALGRAGSAAATGTARWAVAIAANAGRAFGRAAGQAASAARGAVALAGRWAALTARGAGHAAGRAGSAARGAVALAGRGAALTGKGIGRAAGQAASAASAAGKVAGRGATLTGKGIGRAAGQAASAASAAGKVAGRGAALTGKGIGRAAGQAASAASAAGSVAGRGAALTGKGIGRAAMTLPRKLYFAVSDLAELLPRPLIRPWYLVAALLVIVAVAGVPYARAWLFTTTPALGTIRVESARPDAVVTIDGVSQGRAPVTASVPAGPHRIEITISGRTRTHEVEVAADRETLVQAAGVELKGVGSIRVTTDPAGVEVLVDGVLYGRSPLTIDNLAEGPHTVLVRDGSGSVRQSVRVRADQGVDAALQIRPGWLAVFAPVKLDILENGRSIGSTEGGRILSAPGPHTIELVSQAIGFRETRQVNIKPGEVAAVTIPMPPATIEIVAPAGAEILVDGQSVGQAPLGPLQVAVGTREIVMRHPTLGERRQVISVTYNTPTRVVFE